MAVQLAVAVGVGGGFVRGEEGVDGGLGVDDDLAPAGEGDAHVGAQAVGQRALLGEVAVLDHAGEFGDAL
ncbi:MAG: hypothetical protein R3C45_11545 [Phycisphaerales bacterium]